MITVITRQDEKGICGFQASGHAGYADEGSDIVCAAVSVLLTTCVNAMEQIAGVKPEAVQAKKAPLMLISMPKDLSPQKEHDARIILRSTELGLKDVAMQYPQYLKIK